MNWHERGDHEISEKTGSPPANTAKTLLSAVSAVPHTGISQKSGGRDADRAHHQVQLTTSAFRRLTHCRPLSYQGDLLRKPLPFSYQVLKSSRLMTGNRMNGIHVREMQH